MKKNIRTRIIAKLRDPIWQAIGALIALIALVTSFFIGNLVFHRQQSGRNRLMISSQTSQELTDVPTPVNKRMQVLIDGKEEKGLRFFIFRLEYKGQEPMRPNDFEIPLRGHIPDGRKLLGVQRSSTLEGPYKFDRDSEKMVRDEHAALHFEVTNPNRLHWKNESTSIYSEQRPHEHIPAFIYFIK